MQVSRTVGDQWLVNGGLAEGDRVVIEGLQRIYPGAQVNAAEAAAEDAAPSNATDSSSTANQ